MAQTRTQGAGISKAEWGSDVIAETLRDLGIEYLAINPGATFRGVHDRSDAETISSCGDYASRVRLVGRVARRA